MESKHTVPLDVLARALQAMQGALSGQYLAPLTGDQREDLAGAAGALGYYVEAIQARQKVEVL